MIRYALAWFLASCLTISLAAADEGNKTPASNDISVKKDIVYGEGLIGRTDGPRTRALLMDVYSPANSPTDRADRPAIILAFGGSFHRGDKGEGRYEENGAQSSSMADYCRLFAHEGYVCFSIAYRLTPEDPALSKPGDLGKLMPKALAVSPAATGRIDFAREKMGLPKLDDVGRDQLWQAILAASEDMNTAVAHVRAESETYGIDPDRLAVGGFSAGAITAINTAYGTDAPVKAVVSLSGTMWGYNLAITAKEGQPPLLLVVGQNDLEGIRRGSGQIAALFEQTDIPVATAWVAGFGHFYPMGAVTLAPDLTKAPVSERIVAFVDDALNSDR